MDYIFQAIFSFPGFAIKDEAANSVLGEPIP
jgi:hypothetical protein